MNSKKGNSPKVIFLAIVAVIILVFIFHEIYFNSRPFNLPADSADSKQDERVVSVINESIKAQLEHPARANEDILAEDGENMDLGTTQEHWKELGIENAQMSSEEEERLYLMTVESVKAQLTYLSTRKDESLEKAEDLYLMEEFEKYKENIKSGGGYQLYGGVYQSAGNEYQFYNEIKTIKFSKPRMYNGLSGRIGILNYVEFNDSNANHLTQIFIFKNINGEWKIEKQSEIIVRLDISEDGLIQEIKDGK